MGMAASQVRFLSLQNRKNTIGLNMMTLSNRRTALARDMKRVANEYNTAMNQKQLRWSNDSGVTYHDLTYDTLMKPTDMNQALPYILTDSKGRVVVDDNVISIDGETLKYDNKAVTYRDLATMISSFSGLEEGTNELLFDNSNRLYGGNATKDNIGNLSYTRKPDSGEGTKDPNAYNIVFDKETCQNTLRYNLMLKLGLIDETIDDSIKSENTKLYGKEQYEEGDLYTPDSAMGELLIAKAALEAYTKMKLDTMKHGINVGFLGTATQTRAFTSDQEYGYETTYINNYNNTYSDLKFDLSDEADKKLELDRIDWSKVNASNSGAAGNLAYTLNNNGTINYTYQVDSSASILDAMGTITKTELSTNDFVTNYDKETYGFHHSIRGGIPNYLLTYDTQMSQENYNQDNWNNIYNNDRILVLAKFDDIDNDTWKHTQRGAALKIAKKNLEAYVNVLASDFQAATNEKYSKVQHIRSPREAIGQAIEKAKQSTIEFYNSDNNTQYNNDTDGGWNGVKNYIKNNANGINTIVYAADHDWGDPDRAMIAINGRNLMDTFFEFFDYYFETLQPQVTGLMTGSIDNTANTIYREIAYTNSDTFRLDPGFTSEQVKSSVTLPNGVTGVQVKIKEHALDDGRTKVRDIHLYKNGQVNETLRLVLNADGTVDTNQMYIREDGDFSSDNSRLFTANGWTKVQVGDSNNSVSIGSSSGADVQINYTDSYNTHEDFHIQKNDIHWNPNIVNSVSSLSHVYTIPDNDTEKALRANIDEKQAKVDQLKSNIEEIHSQIGNTAMTRYFDAIFKRIAENGWVYDGDVNNKTDKEGSKNYLNQKLQNGQYFVAEVENIDSKDFSYLVRNANNVSKIFEVYDDNAANQAMSKYEAEKADINSKEKTIDLRLSKLEAEQSAIKTEMDSLKRIIDDNVQKTFKIFT